MDAAPEFTLTLSVTGPGIAIDPATGAITIAADRLQAGIVGSFRLTAVALPLEAPRLVAAPALAGPAVIGQAVTVDPGVWEGAAALALEWRRDGAPIADASGPDYLCVAADDGAAIDVRVTATNVAGATEAATGALVVVHAAPRVAGALADLDLELDSGTATVEAAAAFAGEGLAFAVEGAGASIDAATGRVAIPTGALRAGETVTVTATNSGGSASASFRVTVAAAAPGLAAPVAVGRIGDVSFPLDGGSRSVSTQSHFAGEGLTYALVAAPAGVTIHAGSGLVEVRTTAALSGATVTVRASNAGGAATQSFALTVAAAPVAGATSFNAAAALADVGFVAEGAAPVWELKGGAQARLTPSGTGRVHADWKQAGGDGLYRALVRWNASATGVRGSSPFAFGARIARSGADFAGLYVEAIRISGTERQLRLQQYTGAGTETTLLATAPSAWVWYTWYWFEMELRGASVKARLYDRDAAAPDWQLAGTTTHAAAGLVGPSAIPLAGFAPFVDIQQLEFVPAGGTATPAAPAAAADGDWDLNEITEQK